jgi:hypothetical protein
MKMSLVIDQAELIYPHYRDTKRVLKRPLGFSSGALAEV